MFHDRHEPLSDKKDLNASPLYVGASKPWNTYRYITDFIFRWNGLWANNEKLLTEVRLHTPR